MCRFASAEAQSWLLNWYSTIKCKCCKEYGRECCKTGTLMCADKCRHTQSGHNEKDRDELDFSHVKVFGNGWESWTSPGRA